MATRKTPTQQPPTISPQRALKELAKQSEKLKSLKSSRHDDESSGAAEWAHYTRSIIEGTFGSPCSQLESFDRAETTGGLWHSGMTDRDIQRQYVERIVAHDAALSAAISALRLRLPEEEIKGVYQPGDEYTFYRDLSSLFEAAQQEIFIVDAYLDQKLFDLYVSKVSSGAKVRVLSNNIAANVQTLARMYASSKPLEMRTSTGVHDRHAFIDQRGWVIGQSIKDAARKKPTYLVELDDPALGATKAAYESLWLAGMVII